MNVTTTTGKGPVGVAGFPALPIDARHYSGVATSPGVTQIPVNVRAANTCPAVLSRVNGVFRRLKVMAA